MTVARTDVDGLEDGEVQGLDEEPLGLDDAVDDALAEEDDDGEQLLDEDSLGLEVRVGDTLALELEEPVGDTLAEEDDDGEQELDGFPLELAEPEGDVEGTHSLVLDEDEALVDGDTDVDSLGLDDEHTSVFTVCTNGGTPPLVIDPVTV